MADRDGNGIEQEVSEDAALVEKLVKRRRRRRKRKNVEDNPVPGMTGLLGVGDGDPTNVLSEPTSKSAPVRTEGDRSRTTVTAGAIGVIFIFLIAFIIFLLSDDGDDKKKTSTNPAPASSSNSSGSGPLADIAGHYVMTKGLDDPNGSDVVFLSPGAYAITPSGGALTIDIDDKGQVTGGSYHAHIDAKNPDLECSFDFDSSRITGSVSKTDAGVTGSVTIEGSSSTSGESCADLNAPGFVHAIGITDTMLMCPTAIAPAGNSCTGEASRRVAILERQAA